MHQRSTALATCFRLRLSPHQDLGQLIVRYVRQLDAMVLGDHQLHRRRISNI